MSYTTTTREHTRSSLNVKLFNSSELNTVVKANRARNSAYRKEKAAEKKHQSALPLGEVAWDQMFDDDIF